MTSPTLLLHAFLKEEMASTCCGLNEGAASLNEVEIVMHVIGAHDVWWCLLTYRST